MPVLTYKFFGTGAPCAPASPFGLPCTACGAQMKASDPVTTGNWHGCHVTQFPISNLARAALGLMIVFNVVHAVKYT